MYLKLHPLVTYIRLLFVCPDCLIVCAARHNDMPGENVILRLIFPEGIVIGVCILFHFCLKSIIQGLLLLRRIFT